MEITRAVWSTDESHQEGEGRGNPGQMFADEYQEHVKAIAQKAPISTAPFDAQRNAAASWSKQQACQTIDVVLTNICAEQHPPNEAQRIFCAISSVD